VSQLGGIYIWTLVYIYIYDSSATGPLTNYVSYFDNAMFTSMDIYAAGWSISYMSWLKYLCTILSTYMYTYNKSYSLAGVNAVLCIHCSDEECKKHQMNHLSTFLNVPQIFLKTDGADRST